MSNEIMEVNNESLVPSDDIKRLIYTVRGKQVMVDSDVAMLYNCETKYVNRVVKRNKVRFPDEFCFQINEGELYNLRCQNVTSSSSSNYGGRRYLPYVFTEQGIAMLSALLKSDIAIRVSINIMNAFIDMRKLLYFNGLTFERLNNIENKLLEYDKKFEEVFNKLQYEEEFKQKVFFKGQIYDSYSLIVDIIRKAKKSIIIIDNYIDDSVLKMLVKKNSGVDVTIISSNNCSISELDAQKFNEEYPFLSIKISNKFHDRFMIIDEKVLYHCGASIKDLGRKCFAINKIEDKVILEKVIDLCEK